MPTLGSILYTIGHSNRSLEEFLHVLEAHGITAIADVRSQPYSKRNPQFNRESLSESLKQRGIAYVFLGRELGARSNDPACYIGDQVQFDRLAKTEIFREGAERVLQGMERYNVALMCAEKEPLSCHRTILVARHFDELGISVQHILSATDAESHSNTLERLLRDLHLNTSNLFLKKPTLIAEAYRLQSERMAYRREPSVPPTEE